MGEMQGDIKLLGETDREIEKETEKFEIELERET
jgi:hypothetical protein